VQGDARGKSGPELAGAGGAGQFLGFSPFSKISSSWPVSLPATAWISLWAREGEGPRINTHTVGNDKQGGPEELEAIIESPRHTGACVVGEPRAQNGAEPIAVPHYGEAVPLASVVLPHGLPPAWLGGRWM
jgi:hypothetical protein